MLTAVRTLVVERNAGNFLQSNHAGGQANGAHKVAGAGEGGRKEKSGLRGGGGIVVARG